jgi:nucleotide-binding universal stress UspA family protein
MYYKHIMFPVDGSDASRKAELECFAFARSEGAKVTALHVLSHFHLHYQPWAAPREMHAKIEREHDEEALEVAREKMSELEQRASAGGVSCEGLVVVGDRPYEAIIENAEKLRCDLIMMASHGRMGLDAMLLGSETLKVLTHSKIPVLVVR